MRTLQGIPVSPGVAIAPAFWLRTADSMPMQRTIPRHAVAAEIDRFNGALEAAREELGAMAAKAGLTDAVGSIVAGHREFLRDPTLHREVEDAIRNGRSAADYACAVVFRRWIERFKTLEDPFFRQRYLDLLDLERRVLRQLRDETAAPRPTPEKPAVLISPDLTPSEAIGLDRKSFVGFATELGGATSHTAIIAKSLAIPAVCGLGPLADSVPQGETVIVDGELGRLIVAPDAGTLERFRARQDRLRRRTRVL